MKKSGPTHIKFAIEHENNHQYLGIGGKLLDTLKKRMESTKTDSLRWTRVLPDGTTLQVSSIAGIDHVYTDVSTSGWYQEEQLAKALAEGSGADDGLSEEDQIELQGEDPANCPNSVLPEYHWVYKSPAGSFWHLKADLEVITGGSIFPGSLISAKVTVTLVAPFRCSNEVPVDRVIGVYIATFRGELLQTGFGLPADHCFTVSDDGSKVLIAWSGSASEDTAQPNYNFLGNKLIGGVSRLTISGEHDFKTNQSLTISHKVTRDCNECLKRPVTADYSGVSLPSYKNFQDQCYLYAYVDKFGKEYYIEYVEVWEPRTDATYPDGEPQYRTGSVLVNGTRVLHVYFHLLYQGTNQHLTGELNSIPYSETLIDSSPGSEVYYWSHLWRPVSGPIPRIHAKGIVRWEVRTYLEVETNRFNYGAVTGYNGVIYTQEQEADPGSKVYVFNEETLNLELVDP